LFCWLRDFAIGECRFGAGGPFREHSAGSEFELAGRQPVERYTEEAFGFVRVPTKYSPNALALDLSTPYILRATFERDLPAVSGNSRLRAAALPYSWWMQCGRED